jgi:hypothetical protein
MTDDGWVKITPESTKAIVGFHLPVAAVAMPEDGSDPIASDFAMVWAYGVGDWNLATGGIGTNGRLTHYKIIGKPKR